MKPFALIHVIVVVFSPTLFAENDPRTEFFADLELAQARYRASWSKSIREADRVVVYLVNFETVEKTDDFADGEAEILISPYDRYARVLTAKEVPRDYFRRVLDALSTQIAKSEHTGGAFCHFPIHGIRVYHGDELLHEGTFCWVCGNFSFSYPQGTGWLDTSKELEEIFADLLPIPKKELNRFHEKYPEVKRKDNKAGTTSAANPGD